MFPTNAWANSWGKSWGVSWGQVDSGRSGYWRLFFAEMQAAADEADSRELDDTKKVVRKKKKLRTFNLDDEFEDFNVELKPLSAFKRLEIPVSNIGSISNELTVMVSEYRAKVVYSEAVKKAVIEAKRLADEDEEHALTLLLL